MHEAKEDPERTPPRRRVVKKKTTNSKELQAQEELIKLLVSIIKSSKTNKDKK